MQTSIDSVPNPTDARSYQTLNRASLASCIQRLRFSSPPKIECDHFGTWRAATHHIVQQLTHMNFGNKATCDWLPQASDCSFAAVSSNNGNKDTAAILHPSPALNAFTERAQQHPELSPYPHVDAFWQRKVISKVISTKIVPAPAEFSPFPSDLAPTRGSGSHAGGRPQSPQPHCYRIRPSGLALITIPSNPKR